MSDARSLTLLHLSDLHFGQARGEATARFDQKLVTAALLNDIQKQVAEGLRPDAILVTGDVAFSAQPGEYADAGKWLKAVQEATNLPPARVFIVPGNHDVDRKKAVETRTGRNAHRDARQSPHTELDYYINARQELALALWPKLSAFAEFCGGFGAPTISAEKPFWKLELPIPFGKPVIVLGLNSCLLSFDGEDAPSNLALGLGQLQPAFADLPEDALLLVLAHHPPEWLVDGNAGQHSSVRPEHALNTFLQKHPHVLFVGHVHQQGGLVSHPLHTGGQLRFVAGAGHESAQEGGKHAYAWLRLHAEGIDFYPRMWNPERGQFQPEANRFTLEKGEAYIRIRRTKLADRLEKWLERPPISAAASGEPRLPTPFTPPAWSSWAQKEYESLTPVCSAQQPISFRLTQVYVELHATWQSPAEREAERTAAEAQAKARKKRRASRPEPHEDASGPRRRALPALLELPGVHHLLVRGGPGSGKSTALRRMLLQHLQSPGPEGVLAVYLELKELGTWLKRHPEAGQTPALFLDWAGEQLGARGLSREALKSRSGHGRLLWLLDGLDEVVPDEVRHRAAQVIGGYFRHAEGTPDRWLVTGRPHAFEDAQVRHALSAEGHVLELDPLTDEEREEYLQKWFREVYPHSEEKAEEEATRLTQAIPQHEAVEKLSRTPLLLSTIAVVYFNGRKLPERRADLYHEAVNLMLARRFEGHAKPGAQTQRSVRRALSLAAREMMEQGDVRSLARVDFERVLSEAFYPGGMSEGQRQERDALMEWLGAQSGLLELRGDPLRYTFSHLGFQEFLCAEWYASEPNPLKALGNHLDEPFWREVALLTGGILLMQGWGRLGEGFLEGLYKRTKSVVSRGRRSALLATIIREAPGDALPQGLGEEVKPRFVEVLESVKLATTWQERNEVGLTLGKLGDPRLGMENSARWVWVPPGRFRMGSNDRKHEKPIHEVVFKRGFCLGKYPVTVQEYRAFKEGGGYHTRDWWSEDGWRFCEAEEKRTLAWWQVQDAMAPNQPVVGVSWWEAEAYCAWQSSRWAESAPAWLREKLEVSGSGVKVRLPSEAEWEYAARGPESQKYPWGEADPTPELANFARNVGRTTPVGQYPKGASWVGALDLAGNVWEWCLDSYAPYNDNDKVTAVDPIVIVGDSSRVLRGGAWSLDVPDWLRGAFRGGYRPGDRDGDLGFRVVWVSVSAEHGLDLDP